MRFCFEHALLLSSSEKIEEKTFVNDVCNARLAQHQERALDGVRPVRHERILRVPGRGYGREHMLWNTRYVFWTHLPKIGIFTNAETNRSRSKADSREGDTQFLLIPDIGPFLPKLSRYLPAISTIPGKERNHSMNIT